MNEEIQEIPVNIEGSIESVLPAGGVWMSALDLAKFMRVELSQGLGDEGERLIETDAILKRREKKIQAGDKCYYGLGMGMRQQEGLNWVGHNGNTLGFSALMEFLPEKNMGIPSSRIHAQRYNGSGNCAQNLERASEIK